MRYLRRGRDSLEEEGGRAGPLGSAGLGGVYFKISGLGGFTFISLRHVWVVLDSRTGWGLLFD